MAGSLLEAVARARDKRNLAAAKHDIADQELRSAIVQAKRAHTWNEIAQAAGLSRIRIRQIGGYGGGPTTRKDGEADGTE